MFLLIFQTIFKVCKNYIYALFTILVFENGLRKETEILVETNFRSFVFFSLKIQKCCFWLYSLPVHLWQYLVIKLSVIFQSHNEFLLLSLLIRETKISYYEYNSWKTGWIVYILYFSLLMVWVNCYIFFIFNRL